LAKSSPDMSPQSDSGIVHKTKASLASMAGLSPAPPVPLAKQGPRPLMLNSTHLMTVVKPSQTSRSATNTPTQYHGQWSDVMKAKGHAMHKGSHSSISSLSPSDVLGRPTWKGSRSDAELDSRVVPINRRSVSPMAPGYRMPQDRPPSTGSSSDRALRVPQRPPSKSHQDKGWNPINIPDSPPFSTSPVPLTPITDGLLENGDVSDEEHQRAGPVVLPVPDVPLEAPPQRKLTRKKTPNYPATQIEVASDVPMPAVPSLNPRVRSKRYPQRPTNLRTKSRPGTMPEKTPSPNSLAPDGPGVQEIAVLTPRAATFDASESSSTSTSPTYPHLLRRSRKVSTDGQEPRVRKISTERPKIRKVSSDLKGKRESAANEGDDESYGDLLSAYESED
jgi:hypothetical protein